MSVSNYEEIWRKLDHIGPIVIDSGVEVRTGFTEEAGRVKKIIRFIDEEKELARVCGDCWGLDLSCNGELIGSFKEELIRVIEYQQFLVD